MRTMSLRLADEQADALDLIARADSIHVSEIVRDAIRDQIEKRRSDPAFQERLQGALERNKEALRLLADSD